MIPTDMRLPLAVAAGMVKQHHAAVDTQGKHTRTGGGSAEEEVTRCAEQKRSKDGAPSVPDVHGG